MGKVIKLADYIYPWKEVLTVDGPASTLQVYVNEYTGEAEIFQMNDDSEAIRTVLTADDAALLHAALTLRDEKATK